MEKALVLGAGKSGIEASELLLKTGYDVFLFDGNRSLDREKIASSVEKEEGAGTLTVLLGDESLSSLPPVSFSVISPGISLEAPTARAVAEKKIPILSEIELAYRYEKGTVAGITGTNGKTTTTTLTGDILRAFKGAEREFTVGNIGIPYAREVLKTTAGSVSVIELSSFQLETIDTFHPHVSAVLNITPDHLNRHHTMEEYTRVKMRIAENATEDDTVVLNAGDPILREEAKKLKRPKIVWFSGNGPLKEGYYLSGNELRRARGGCDELLLKTEETTLVGKCNYENILAAYAIADAFSVPDEVTRETIRGFRAVPHRIEYIRTLNGVKYYNDSKGTNPDAAIQGIRAMDGKTYLIGGGYDKGSEFDEWIEAFGGKVKKLILIGATKEKIRETALRHGFSDVVFRETLEDAVKYARDNALPGENVLLSPACASWDMFRSYEERGDVFRSLVNTFS